MDLTPGRGNFAAKFKATDLKGFTHLKVFKAEAHYFAVKAKFRSPT